MSTRTTSANPASAIRWAVVAPTLPAPMTVTLLRVMCSESPSGRAAGGRFYARAAGESSFVGGGDGRTSMAAARWGLDARGRPLRTGAPPMSKSTPVAILAVLGAVIAVLGLFVAGNIVMVAVGLVAVFGAGLLDIVAIRAARP